MRILTLVAGLSLVVFGMHGACADEIPVAKAKALCDAGNTGPRTPFGETKEEAAAKKTAFAFSCGTLVYGKPQVTFKKYVAADFCDHSHLLTAGLKPCASAEEALRFLSAGAADSAAKTGTIEMPLSAAVDGEIVTMYGAGVDVFRVHNGKITDHWDGGPAKSLQLKMDANATAMAACMQRQIDTGARQGPGDAPACLGPPPAANK
jgi:hypothetical protein